MVLAGVLLAAPAIARAANCTPDPSWGTPNTAYAEQVAVQLNQQRAANGLGPLLVSPLLTNSAEWKSLHMAHYGYLDHNDPAPPVARTAEDRMADCGYTFQVAIGENIADGFSTPSSVVAAWMGSDGHRANILGASFTVMGVGVAADSSGFEFWTVDFGGYTDPGSVAAGADPTPPPAPAPPQPVTTAPPPSTASTPTASTPTTSTTKTGGGTTTSGGSTGGGGSSAKGASAQAGSVVAPVTLASHLVAEPDRVKAHPGKVEDPASPAERRQPGVRPASHRPRAAPAARQPCPRDARRTQDPAAAPAPRARDEAARVPRHHGIGRGGPGRGHDRHRSRLRPQGRRLSPCGR